MIGRPPIGDFYTVNGQEQAGEWYSGPVPGLVNDIILATHENINVTSHLADVFIHTGSGMDAIDVSATGGNNVLDGSTNSNFLVGGAGNDQFYVDDRNPVSDIWSTVAGFHHGDSATIWGVTPRDFGIQLFDDQGAPGWHGLTLSITKDGAPNANLTLAGYAKADVFDGNLAFSFGHTPDLPNLPGSDYLLVT